MNIYTLHSLNKTMAVIILVTTIILCVIYYEREHCLPFYIFAMLVYAIIYFFWNYFVLKVDPIYRYIYYIKNTDHIDLVKPKLAIKKSTVPNAGDGVFAEEFIPKGTIFHEFSMKNINHKPCLFHKINDLAYTGNANAYEQNSLEDDPTNIEYVTVQKNGILGQLHDYLTSSNTDELFDKAYLRARRDIRPGDELSKYYGVEVWRDYEKDSGHHHCNHQ